MHSEAARPRHIWNNLPLHFKGLMLLMVPAPALLLALVVLSGSLREERQALSSVESLTAARQRLQDISTVLLVPGAPAQDHSALARMAKDLGPISADADRWREVEAVIQQKLDSLSALSQTASPDKSLLDTDRQATESLHSYISALTLEYDQLLIAELNRVKAARARVFRVCFKGAFVFLLGELLAALAFLGAIVQQVRSLKTNSRRLAEGLPLEPLFTDNWELNQIGHDLVKASVELARRERALEAGAGRTPDSELAERILHSEQQDSMMEQLRERNQKLAEALASKGHFLAGLSREVRIALSSVLGFSELLYDGKLGPLSEQQKGCVSDILAGSKRMLQLADSVASNARANVAPAPPSAEPVDLEKLLKEVQSSLAPAARKKGVHVEVNVDPSLRQVTAVPGKLRELLDRHLADAIQFTPHDASLELHVRPENNHAIRLEVHITGLGLPPKEVVRLFPAFRLGPLSMGAAVGQDADASEQREVFYAILPGITRPTEPAVRTRTVRSRGAGETASTLVH